MLVTWDCGGIVGIEPLHYFLLRSARDYSHFDTAVEGGRELFLRTVVKSKQIVKSTTKLPNVIY